MEKETIERQNYLKKVKAVGEDSKKSSQRAIAGKLDISKSEIHRMILSSKAPEFAKKMYLLGEIDKYTLALCGRFRDNKEFLEVVEGGFIPSFGIAIKYLGVKRSVV